ncbi:MAG: sigma-54-dependent Fis family transcriptional regulator [Tepidisphaera sp.]
MSMILVVDDKESLRDSVGGTLERAGFEVVLAADGAAALAMIAKQRPDCVVSDLKMPGMTGLELLEKIRAIDEDLPLVLMTAFASIQTAVEAIRLGAFNYLQKPFEGDELIINVKRAIEHAGLKKENAMLRAGMEPAAAVVPAPAGETLSERRGVERLIGDSAGMQLLKAEIKSVAASQGTVLITGESGAGKEVIARSIHEESSRAGKPFLAVNCAALSETVLESELFGHERGAFTGADKLRKGRFELADGGTLLLDEISEVSPKIQAKLLRVLQERQFERVGSSTSIGVDVRVIATSNRVLLKEVTAGTFRQDLYYRLNVLPVAAPSLRARLEDVPALATHFVAEICRREGRGPMRLEPAALDLLREYTWPGNVRELQNICERAVVLSAGRQSTTIPRGLIEPWLRPAGEPQVTLAGSIIEAKPGFGEGQVRTLEDIERETIVATLTRFSGHRQKTATALGIGVRTLGLKLKKWKEDRLIPEAL